MEEKKLETIVGEAVRPVIQKANKLGLTREDIVSIFTYEGQVFLVYFK